MPKSDYDFTVKFFRPPQRTVPFHNGLLDTRTKHTIAQDRLVVAEQRIVDAERRKSTNNLQSLAFEQKQLEKRIASLYSNLNSSPSNRPLKMRGRSTSEIIFRNMRQSSIWNDTSPIRRSKFSVSLHNSNQNLLTLPKIDDFKRRFSAYSDDDTSDNHFFTSDMDSGEEENIETRTKSISNLNPINLKRITTKKKSISKLGNKHKPLPPIVSIIPPDEEILFLTQ